MCLGNLRNLVVDPNHFLFFTYEFYIIPPISIIRLHLPNNQLSSINFHCSMSCFGWCVVFFQVSSCWHSFGRKTSSTNNWDDTIQADFHDDHLRVLQGRSEVRLPWWPFDTFRSASRDIPFGNPDWSIERVQPKRPFPLQIRPCSTGPWFLGEG